ncbi:MAG: type II secretion system protein [Candidatus Riflebacteria bacterium]|nr:type II secretion system protein [Candidatus Riflebacteria bacterium]
MKGTKASRGITMVEITIGVLIISILMAAVMKMMGAGMRGSTKGMAHLANMEAAAVLMSQIEYDLLRASSIVDPPAGEKAEVARWDILTNEGSGKSTIIYNLLNNGIERKLDSGSEKHDYIYCKGLDVKLAFRHVKFDDAAATAFRSGMWVELSVASSKKSNNNEEFKMKRLILCKNILTQP